MQNIIDETDLDNLSKQINDLSYEELDFHLCKLFTAKSCKDTTIPHAFMNSPYYYI